MLPLYLITLFVVSRCVPTVDNIDDDIKLLQTPPLRPELIRNKSGLTTTKSDQFELPHLDLIVFKFGAKDEILLWKGQMKHTTQYKHPEEGTSILDFWGDWNLDTVIETYLEAKESRLSTAVSRPIDGAYYSWRFIPHPELPEISGYLIDTTTLKTARSEEVAQQFSDLKATLFRVLSHVIRNPLYQLTMQLQQVIDKLPILKAARKTAITTEMGQTITFQTILNEISQHTSQSQTHVSEVLRITNLVEDYIQFEDNQLCLKEECFDVIALLQEIWHEWRDAAKQKQIRMELEIEPLVEGRHPSITSDKIRLRKAIISALENSIQHTDADGEIFLHLALDRHEMIITVMDSGSGMDGDHITDLITRLEQGIISFHQDASVGLGISLTLTYHTVVKMMKGQFHIRSLQRDLDQTPRPQTPGSNDIRLPLYAFSTTKHSGLAVQMQIPLPDDSVVFFSSKQETGLVLGTIEQETRRPSMHTRFASQTTAQVAGADSLKYNGIKLTLPTRHHVLVVDDDPVNLKYLVKVLQKQGHEHLLTATNGQEASNIYQRNYKTIRLILTDLQMPSSSGFDLAIKVRAYEKSFRLNVQMPIVAVTAAGASSELRQQCLEHGMSDMLSKPITKNDVQLIIAKFAL